MAGQTSEVTPIPSHPLRRAGIKKWDIIDAQVFFFGAHKFNCVLWRFNMSAALARQSQSQSQYYRLHNVPNLHNYCNMQNLCNFFPPIFGDYLCEVSCSVTESQIMFRNPKMIKFYPLIRTWVLT